MLDLLLKIDQWLSLNRGLLSYEDEKILEDLQELALVIEETKDEELKKIHTLDFTSKCLMFFRC